MAKDKFHEIVKEALIKDGWKITHDPFRLSEWNPDWEIDLGAEKLLAAERGKEKIAIEIKSFAAESFAYEFHRALGQYLNYIPGLEMLESERLLFLAVPESVYQTEFQRKGIKVSVERYGVRILTFNPSTKSIIQWIR